MSFEYSIHPSIGVARLGNSEEFYLSPVKIGGRPIECDVFGNELYENKNPQYVKKFKDKYRKIKRQAAKFRIFKRDISDPNSIPIEVDLTNQAEIKSIKWTVHLANKKSAWYHFHLFDGDLMIGAGNTYEKHNAQKRNPDIPKEKRDQLIIDFGPRTLDSPNSKLPFQIGSTVPAGYCATVPIHQNNRQPKIGDSITYLGEIITDSKNNLVVLGGKGVIGGDEPFDSFAGGDGWYDDTSDGPIICELEFANGKKEQLDAWVVIGPTKFAPELVNITTLGDMLFDVAVRHQNAIPDMYDLKKWPESKGWNPKFRVNFERDIQPIIERVGHYRWVANVPSMMAFCMPSFDLKDNCTTNMQNRQRYFSYFRRSADNEWGQGGESEKVFTNDDYVSGFPLMPLNAGSNAVENKILDKFVELSRTQYFFLEQWAKGEFDTGPAKDLLGLTYLDHADIGNCVGQPMCPGVEVTWSIKNPSIYSKPFHIKHKKTDLTNYNTRTLTPDYDETKPLEEMDKGEGCEPGDLTKRMAIPWTSDLFECNIQHINFTDKTANTDKDLEKPPLYHAYWWPPQSPWDVILGVTEPEVTQEEIREEKMSRDELRKKKVLEELQAAGVSAGQQVNYIRGINNHMQMVYAWSYLGFIVNQNEAEDREQYPYFVEKERWHEKFEVVGTAVSNRVNIVDPGATRFVTAYFLKEDRGTY